MKVAGEMKPRMQTTTKELTSKLTKQFPTPVCLFVCRSSRKNLWQIPHLTIREKRRVELNNWICTWFCFLFCLWLFIWSTAVARSHSHTDTHINGGRESYNVWHFGGIADRNLSSRACASARERAREYSKHHLQRKNIPRVHVNKEQMNVINEWHV